MSVSGSTHRTGSDTCSRSLPGTAVYHPIPSVPRLATLGRLFGLALILRLLAVFLLNTTGAVSLLTLSKDSGKYHHVGMVIAERMSRGYFEWASWIDNGWYQFVGLVYWIFGPNPVVIQIFNVVIGSATAVVVYRLADEVFEDERVARISGLFNAVLTSFVYYSSLLLKDTLSIFSISVLVLSISRVRQRFSLANISGILVPLIVLLCVSDYLFLACTALACITLVFSREKSVPVVLVRAGVVLLVVGIIGQILGLGFLGIGYAKQTPYFDLDFINDARTGMTAYGTGAIFDDGRSVEWGSDPLSNLRNAATALYYFFFTLDLRNIGSVRQLMALPEVVVFILLLPMLARGMYRAWKRYRWRAMPMFVFVGGLILVYGAATTNMGAMYRWRMQVMPLLVVFIACGLMKRPGRSISSMLERLSRLALPARGAAGYWILPVESAGHRERHDGS